MSPLEKTGQANIPQLPVEETKTQGWTSGQITKAASLGSIITNKGGAQPSRVSVVVPRSAIPPGSTTYVGLARQMFKTQMKPLSMETVKKISDAAQTALSTMSFIRLGQGKAKDVWKPRMDNAVHVYLTPRQGGVVNTIRKIFGMMNSKEVEIREEVQKTKEMKMNLYQKNLTALLEKEKTIGFQSAPAVASGLLSHFGTPQQLQEILASTHRDSILSQFIKDQGLDYISEALTPSVLGKALTAALDVEKLANSPYLALDLEEVEDPNLLTEKYKYAVRTAIASSDLEKMIQTGSIKFPGSAEVGLQFLHGMRDLHRAGFVHGDLKPENVLVYKDPETKKINVKVADFGKAEPLPETDTWYTGNKRFGAPEMKLSAQSEVYSTALVLVRILEEELLSGMQGSAPMLTDPANKDPNAGLATNRRGIENFLILSEDCPQIDTIGLRGKVKAVGLSIQVLPPNVSDKTEQEVHRYIDALVQGLAAKSPGKSQKINELGDLLKNMTILDPENRPTMESAAERYEELYMELIRKEGISNAP